MLLIDYPYHYSIFPQWWLWFIKRHLTSSKSSTLFIESMIVEKILQLCSCYIYLLMRQHCFSKPIFHLNGLNYISEKYRSKSIQSRKFSVAFFYILFSSFYASSTLSCFQLTCWPSGLGCYRNRKSWRSCDSGLNFKACPLGREERDTGLTALRRTGWGQLNPCTLIYMHTESICHQILPLRAITDPASWQLYFYPHPEITQI